MPELLATLPALSAKALVLDLLRMAHPMPLPVNLLVGAGRVLGINENAIRVNITRLLTRGQIKQDERGYYRLGKQAESFDLWLRQWQLGEARVKEWDGSWLVLAISSQLKSKQAISLTRMLKHLGFRNFMPGNMIRPNNLNRSHHFLCEQIASLSGVNDFALSQSQDFPESPQHLPEPEKLWDSAFLERQYREVIDELMRGLSELHSLGVEQAFRVSYQVGAEVHHRLALDPLLPKEFLDTQLRQQVIKLFEQYDAAYRPTWKEFFLGYELKLDKTNYRNMKKVS